MRLGSLLTALAVAAGSAAGVCPEGATAGAAASPAGTYVAFARPSRVVDVRLGAGHHVHPRIAGHGGLPAHGIGAVVATLTAYSPTADGQLVAYPGHRPATTNLYFAKGRTVSNTVVVGLSAGRVNIADSRSRRPRPGRPGRHGLLPFRVGEHARRVPPDSGGARRGHPTRHGRQPARRAGARACVHGDAGGPPGPAEELRRRGRGHHPRGVTDRVRPAARRFAGRPPADPPGRALPVRNGGLGVRDRPARLRLGHPAHECGARRLRPGDRRRRRLLHLRHRRAGRGVRAAAVQRARLARVGRRRDDQVGPGHRARRRPSPAGRRRGRRTARLREPRQPAGVAGRPQPAARARGTHLRRRRHRRRAPSSCRCPPAVASTCTTRPNSTPTSRSTSSATCRPPPSGRGPPSSGATSATSPRTTTRRTSTTMHSEGEQDAAAGSELVLLDIGAQLNDRSGVLLSATNRKIDWAHLVTALDAYSGRLRELVGHRRDRHQQRRRLARVPGPGARPRLGEQGHRRAHRADRRRGRRRGRHRSHLRQHPRAGAGVGGRLPGRDVPAAVLRRVRGRLPEHLRRDRWDLPLRLDRAAVYALAHHGSRVRALPQIYTPDNAVQWANIDATGGGELQFAGALTEHAAAPHRSQRPAQGWAALYRALSARINAPTSPVVDLHD